MNRKVCDTPNDEELEDEYEHEEDGEELDDEEVEGDEEDGLPISLFSEQRLKGYSGYCPRDINIELNFTWEDWLSGKTKPIIKYDFHGKDLDTHVQHLSEKHEISTEEAKQGTLLSILDGTVTCVKNNCGFTMGIRSNAFEQTSYLGSANLTDQIHDHISIVIPDTNGQLYNPKTVLNFDLHNRWDKLKDMCQAYVKRLPESWEDTVGEGKHWEKIVETGKDMYYLRGGSNFHKALSNALSLKSQGKIKDFVDDDIKYVTSTDKLIKVGDENTVKRLHESITKVKRDSVVCDSLYFEFVALSLPDLPSKSEDVNIQQEKLNGIKEILKSHRFCTSSNSFQTFMKRTNQIFATIKTNIKYY